MWIITVSFVCDLRVSKISDTKILKFEDKIEFESVLKSKKLDGKWKLLYRGSRDGFRAGDFHSRCDNKPNTLTLMKTTNGEIFGGFTRAEWDRSDQYKSDGHAFVFSLTRSLKGSLVFDLKSGSFDKSIYCGSSNGPVFGEGPDLFVSDRSNSVANNSYLKLGHTYTHPKLKNVSSAHASSILVTGLQRFQIKEIEVFQKQ